MDDMENMTAEEFDRLAATGQEVELKVNLNRPKTSRHLFTYEVHEFVGVSSDRAAVAVRSTDDGVKPFATA